MQVYFSKGFERSVKAYNPRVKMEILRQTDGLLRALFAKSIPKGVGLKKIRQNIWEYRVGIALRVLFAWQKDRVVLLFAGNHAEVQRYIADL